MQSLLGTVNGILPANLALNPTSVAGGSRPQRRVLRPERAADPAQRRQRHVAGDRSRHRDPEPGARPDRRQRGQRGAARASTSGGSTSSVSTSGNVVTDSVTQHAARGQPLRAGRPAGGADDRGGRARPQHRHRDAQLQRRRGLVLDQRLAADASSTSRSSTSLVNQILARPGPAARSGSALGSLLDAGSSTTTPTGNLLTCDTSAPGTTASAKVGVLNLGLLSALEGGIGLNVGDVSVTGSSTVATPAVATSPATATPPPHRWRRRPAVPNVTTRAHRRVLGGDAADHLDGGHGPGRAAAHRPPPHRLARPLSQLTQPPPGWPMSHSPTDPLRIGRRTATGPGLRDLLRSPSGLGGRPGGGHSTARSTTCATRPGCSAAPVSRRIDAEQVFGGLGGRGRCSGNRCCELLGTGWRNPVPGRCSRRQCG